MLDKYRWFRISVVLFGVFLLPTLIQSVSYTQITTTGPGIDTLTDLSGGNLNRTLALIELNSNFVESPDGFLLQLSSANGGKLVRESSPGVYASSALVGNIAPYTLTLSATGSGSLGCTEPTLPVNNAFTTALNLDFGIGVTASTDAKQYAFKVTITAKESLLSGSYKDVVTVTISDN